MKLSQDYGVEELLPPTVKSSAARAERAAIGPRLKRMMTPKGKGWERSLRARYVCACVLWGRGLIGGQTGCADEGDGWDAEAYRQMEEVGTWQRVEGVAEVEASCVGSVYICLSIIENYSFALSLCAPIACSQYL